MREGAPAPSRNFLETFNTLTVKFPRFQAGTKRNSNVIFFPSDQINLRLGTG
jgi:hypothetical protein